MTDKRDDWNSYWQRAEQSAAYAEGVRQEQELSQFWRQLFRLEFARRHHCSVLDVACGNGAVIRIAQAEANNSDSSACVLAAIDRAEHALRSLRDHGTEVSASVADAANLPFADASFDIVCSQFGMEYAEPAAVQEAGRLVCAGGMLALLLHYRGGAIYQECRRSLQAVSAFRKSRVLPLFSAALAAGVEVARKQARPAKFRKADKALAPVVEQLKAQLAATDTAVAGGQLHRLFADLGHMYQRIEAYEPAEVKRWSKQMDRELQAYTGRMKLMVQAALAEDDINRLAKDVASQGLSVETCKPMAGAEQGLPAAWILVARR